MPETAPDPFLYDAEQLHALTGAPLVERGLRWFKENRVTDLATDSNALWGQVEDPESDEPIAVGLSYEDSGNLRVECLCKPDGDAPCAHAVALLCAHAANTAGTDLALLSAREGALAERRKAGRSEVRVKHLGGEPWFGTWRARSVDADPRFGRSYQVHIRSLHEPTNYCTCPDFAVNQLGTCKHIEAALHRISKRRDYRRLADQSAPHPYIYLDWNTPEAPRIRLFHGAVKGKKLQVLLAAWFDAEGLFSGRLPEDFFRLSEALAGRADIDLGDDAQAHAQRLAEQAARRVRAAEIRERIAETGGRLPGIRATLYPYQMEGVAFLAANGRTLLADDMGLGKTLQAIAAASWLYRHEGVARTLVICPASLKHQWAREIERFTSLPVQIVQGPAAQRRAQYRKLECFTVLNYELALRDLSEINEILCPDLLILDEAQRIKNWRTKIATAVKRIPSRYAFVLTGTPLENRLEDLYSLMQVVDQRLLGPLWRYLADFHVTDERGKVLGYRNLSELRRRLAPAMLRRDRRLVADQLPARIEQRLDVEMTPTQWALHDDAAANAGRLAMIAQRRPLTPSEQNRMMAAMQAARMACNAAGLVDKVTEGSPKIDELAQLLDELCLQGGLKAVVFSQWERMTAMVEERLRGLGLGCVRLHGGVPTAKRGDLTDRFRDDDAVQVFISTDAGGSGLNLQSASVLVNLDVPWNPAILDQRIARVHRLGQKGKVQVILMVAPDSYEERVMRLVAGKRDLFDNVVDPEATADTVGVSKRLLEALAEELAGQPPQADSQDSEAPVPETEGPTTPVPAAHGNGEASEEPPLLAHCIEALQRELGPRIERILGIGGRLLVVIDRVDEAASRLAETLSQHIPVALVDPLTLTGLQRLGDAFPFAVGQVHYDAAAQPQPQGPSLLRRQAEERLEAARLLLEQGSRGPAVELLLSAMLAATADLAGETSAPTAQQAAVWLYGEALPRGLLEEGQAAILIRALALAQAPELPQSMLEAMLTDAQTLLTTHRPRNARQI
ncbi:DEAD/DEAH box helicase [Sedimenticola hydrogenitrophicus]|uniref:DEAD/DEAH box helicase n=1 Tax=Sedimenticola hydrogenitrophicus TaxID=2967975 RepID=UPI0021A26526|nr:DEAD/DEAH box helicase [Sedimenticola hydrogenitrophicus]